MTIFGFDIPLWIVLSVIFGLIYFLFSALSAAKTKKLKEKREQKIDVEHDI